MATIKAPSSADPRSSVRSPPDGDCGWSDVSDGDDMSGVITSLGNALQRVSLKRVSSRIIRIVGPTSRIRRSSYYEITGDEFAAPVSDTTLVKANKRRTRRSEAAVWHSRYLNFLDLVVALRQLFLFSP